MCILVFELHTGIEGLQLAPIGIIPRNTDPISTMLCKARWGSAHIAWLSALIIPLNNVQQSKSTKVLPLNYFWQLFSQSGTHESRAQRLWIPRSLTLILIAETNGWLNYLHNLHNISNSAVSGWMQGSSPCIFSILIFTRPSSFHQSCMWNTPKSGQCPPEFSLTFLGHDDKSQHWAYVSYLELKTSCVTFWLPLTVTCKKGAHVHVLKVSMKRNSKEKRTPHYIGPKTFTYNNDPYGSRWNTAL